MWSPQGSMYIFPNKVETLVKLQVSHTYWNSIRLEMRLHKQEYIHKDIWTMLRMRWSPLPLALPFIAHFHLGWYKQYYGITLLSLRTNLVGLLQPYYFQYYISITTSNLMLHLQQQFHNQKILVVQSKLHHASNLKVLMKLLQLLKAW